jgi:hypothetical protein
MMKSRVQLLLFMVTAACGSSPGDLANPCEDLVTASQNSAAKATTCLLDAGYPIVDGGPCTPDLAASLAACTSDCTGSDLVTVENVANCMAAYASFAGCNLPEDDTIENNCVSDAGPLSSRCTPGYNAILQCTGG